MGHLVILICGVVRGFGGGKKHNSMVRCTGLSEGRCGSVFLEVWLEVGQTDSSTIN